jgi:uncharacterized protein (TIGR00730 family)
MIKRICVFCGSSNGNRPEYQAAAHSLGQEFVRNQVGLVYGGGSTGLMGIVANSVLEGGGHVIGVVPRALQEREIENNQIQELYIVESMHERKAMMAEKSDAFIAMPGGFGTYEELFEILTWALLGIHRKPILLLNVMGYFNPFVQIVEHGVAEGFIRQNDPSLIRITDDPTQVVPMLQASPEQPFRAKWLDMDET